MSTQPKIDYLTIHGFQSIQHLDRLPLGNLNVLIGANGTGKSNFVSYFRMLNMLVNQRLQVWVQERGGSDRLLSFGVKETQTIYSHIDFGINAYAFKLTPTLDGGLVFSDERTFVYDNTTATENFLGSGQREALLLDNAQPATIEYTCYNAIANWQVYHFHDTSDTALVKRYGVLHDNKYLRTDAANLAAYLYQLQHHHPTVYQQIEQTVRLAVPFFARFVLEPETRRRDEPEIRLMWQHRDSDYALWASQLSDGSLRFICLVAALLQPNPPTTMIIDEPELGLHPYAITLLGALMRAASHVTQLIVATQSVQLLNEFRLEDLIVVEQVGGVSDFRRLNEPDFTTWLEEYTLGELWEKNILGGRPR